MSEELESLGGLCQPYHPDCPRRAENQQQAEQLTATETALIDEGHKRIDAEAEAKRLKEFSRTVIKEECWGYDSLDGYEVQDLAETLGLIKKHIATESDVSEEDDYAVGDTIYKFTDILAAPQQKGQDNE